MIKLSQSWPVGTPSNWLHVHMTCVHHSLKTSFLSSTRYSRFILNVSALSYNQPFLQEAGVPFQLKKNGIQKSRSRHEMCSFQLGYCYYCCSQVLTLPEDRAKKSMYVRVSIHLCVHFTPILYLYLSILIKIHEFTTILLILTYHHRIHSSFPPFNICNSLLQQ